MIDDRITVVVGKEFKKKVKLFCIKNNISIKEYIVMLIEKDLNK